jgi:REP element-mobilizing transposase RayT
MPRDDTDVGGQQEAIVSPTIVAFTRRHLPHWIPENAAVFVTWRLAGSLPRSEWDRPSSFAACQSSLKDAGLTDDTNRSSVLPRLLEQDEQLDDAGGGKDWLQDSRIASVVVNALLYGETVRHFYQLHAWVVMPNHVHAIFQPSAELSTIMRWVKGRTSRVANQILGRTGTPFWQNESFDHWIRSAEELEYLTRYVENNPLKAGLVEAREKWRWSSASWAQGLTDDTNRSSVLPPR